MGTFGIESLSIDEAAEVERITSGIRDYARRFRRKGAVVAVSGGIDSSVVAALCVRALGRERVLTLQMPESESSGETLPISTELVQWLGVDSVVEDITPILEAYGCYRRRDDAIRRVFPDYGPGHKSKIILPSVVDSDQYRLYSVVVESPDGTRDQRRLTTDAYLEIVAATNFKQRVRKSLEYYHSDRLNHFVAGTPNRLEYDQGFFVKNGDGSADVKPIAHLYKSQVYGMARHLGLPRRVCDAVPTTDTYSLEQGQDEFYFALPFKDMDLALWALNHGVSTASLASTLGVDEAVAKAVYDDIRNKRRTTRYLHLAPVLVEPVVEVD